jgi:alcohol dehydrogenase
MQDLSPTSEPTADIKDGLLKLTAFDYQPRTRVIFGRGKLADLPDACRETGGSRILLVTDKGLEEAGHVQRAVDLLQRAGWMVLLFDEVHPNPTTDDVDRGLAVAREAEIDLFVALGGGSSMDCATGINFLLTNGGKVEDYWGVGKATKPMLPLVAIPTTAGTGSEAQSFALIANSQTHMKMACGDPKAACRTAILDPELTVSMTASVTATTGIDAISHAVESFVTTKRNPVSHLFARQAWQLLAEGFPAVFRDGSDLDARGRMLLGSHLAGAAIENSMLGATHALANPLSAHFDLTHGVAIGVMLPHVVRYNAAHVGRLYGDLAADLHLARRTDSHAGTALADFLSGLCARASLPQRLRDCGATQDLFGTMSEEAAKQWTGTFNPRPVNAAVLKQLYEAAW